MYKWNDENIKKCFDKEMFFAKKSFSEEELKSLYLNQLNKQTKSKRILHMINLAYQLGKLKGIQEVDECKTHIVLR